MSETAQIFDLPPDERRAALSRLLLEEAHASASMHPLSHGQQSMWFLHQLEPASPAYTITYAGRILGDLDVRRLTRCIETLVQRHPILRTTYAMHDGKPAQFVHPQWPVQLAHHDLEPGENALDRWLRREANRPFDLQTGPVFRPTLLRRAGNEHILVWSIHHIAVDFWSIDLLLDQLRGLYAEHPSPAPPAPSAYRYVDYVTWQRDMLAGPEGERLWEYWRDQLAGDVPILQLPTDRPRRSVQSYHGAVARFTLSKEVTAALKRVGQSVGATPYSTMLAAYATLLYRYSGQDDIVIGSPFAGRDRPEIEDVVGYVANPLVLRANLAGDPTFLSLLERIKQMLLGAIAHQDYPLALLVERLRPARGRGHAPLYQASFAWEQIRRFGQEAVEAGPSAAASLDLQTAHLAQGGAPAELTLFAGEVDDKLTGVLQYNTDLFDDATVERMVGHFLTLLGGIAAAPESHLSELPLLTPRELDQQATWNDTAVTYDAPGCLHELISEAVQRNPDATALWCDGRTMTYAELDRRADALAVRLQGLGVCAETIVPIILERSEETIVGMLGVLKAGGAFMLLDPEQPAKRMAAMLGDVADTPVIITQRMLAERLTEFGAHRLCVDEPWPTFPLERSGARAEVTADSLAYVMYTSGSTGRPKGALNTHRGICNRLLWMRDNFNLTTAGSVLFNTPVTFDICLLEVFWPLITGARVVIARRDGHKDNEYLVRTIVEQSVTAMYVVPSLLRPLLAKLAAVDYRGLTFLSSAGEALPYELAQRCLATLDAELWNEYGPAECAVVTTYFPCARGTLRPPMLIGRPQANVRVHLLDAHHQPVPIGVPAELFIGGVGVGRGYLNRPDETKDRFIPDVFADSPGQTLYKTGDLARYLPDGNIEYLGRLDHQVKIRGVRIEPGEVETTLALHPDVEHNIVVAENDERGGVRLGAYVVTAGDAQPTVSELRRFLLEHLPPAMVPAVFRFIETFPLTPNRKIDLRALQAAASAPDKQAPAFVAPRTPAERLLADIWRDVLELDEVGVFDDFFDIGGASSTSLEIAVRAKEAGVPLTPQSLFIYGTIAELANEYGQAVDDSPVVCSSESDATDDDHNGESPDERAEETAAAAAIGSDGLGPRNTVIESLGMYLPAGVRDTRTIVAECRNEVGVPLEHLTGIQSRRVVGPDEYSIDLARLAMDDCFARSSYRPEDIDLIIACNISRCDGPDHRFSYEPSTAARLRYQRGLQNALAFDVSNACAGMFTGIALADGFLKTGRARTAMVVSGEFASHLIDTAQKEIEGPMDPRMSCLTVGDAGAAIILERGPNNLVGFHDIDLATLGRYSSLCIGKLTDQPHGGATMSVDAIGITAVAVRHLVPFVDTIMKRNNWRPDQCDHIIIHQTSEASLRDGMTTFNRMYGATVAHRGNTIHNLRERGNTVSTTHFVALADNIQTNRIQSGDTVVFAISGSGQTVGGALYTLDDLPDRTRRRSNDPDRRRTAAAASPVRPPATHVQVSSVGIAAQQLAPASSIDMAVKAARNCLESSPLSSCQLGLIVHAGVYRDDYIGEPPIAAFIAGGLGVTQELSSADDPKTLAFDLLNGGVGFLDACHAAIQMIDAGKTEHAMIVASEIENNSIDSGRQRYGLHETGSAVILSRGDGRKGFGRFVFHHYGEHCDALSTYTKYENGETWLQIDRATDVTALYLKYIPAAVDELLASEPLDRSSITVVLAPFLSTADRNLLADCLGIPAERIADVPSNGDLFTSNIPCWFDYLQNEHLVQAGDVGLIITAGSGIQIGCATYYF